MQSVIDLQNTLLELQDIITNTINPVFTDLGNASGSFTPVIDSHNVLIQKIDEMVAFLNSGIIQGLKGDQGDQGGEGLSVYQVATINGFIGTVTEWLQSLKGDKGDSATPAPFGFFSLGAVTIPALNSVFTIPNATHGNLTIQNGNILLKAGFSYDIDFNPLVNFSSTSAGYLLYDIVCSVFSTPLFQEVAMVSSATNYRDSQSMRFITPKLLSDIEIPVFARARSSCTALINGYISIRGHYV